MVDITAIKVKTPKTDKTKGGMVCSSKSEKKVSPFSKVSPLPLTTITQRKTKRTKIKLEEIRLFCAIAGVLAD